MSPELADWPARRNPIRPNPTLARLTRWLPSVTAKHLADPESPVTAPRTASEPVGPRCPNPRQQDPWLSDAPLPGPLLDRRPHR